MNKTRGYQMKDGEYTTPCPIKKLLDEDSVMIGSQACELCNKFVGKENGRGLYVWCGVNDTDEMVLRDKKGESLEVEGVKTDSTMNKERFVKDVAELVKEQRLSNKLGFIEIGKSSSLSGFGCGFEKLFEVFLPIKILTSSLRSDTLYYFGYSDLFDEIDGCDYPMYEVTFQRFEKIARLVSIDRMKIEVPEDCFV